MPDYAGDDIAGISISPLSLLRKPFPRRLFVANGPRFLRRTGPPPTDPHSGVTGVPAGRAAPALAVSAAGKWVCQTGNGGAVRWKIVGLQRGGRGSLADGLDHVEEKRSAHHDDHQGEGYFQFGHVAVNRGTQEGHDSHSQQEADGYPDGYYRKYSSSHTITLK